VFGVGTDGTYIFHVTVSVDGVDFANIPIVTLEKKGNTCTTRLVGNSANGGGKVITPWVYLEAFDNPVTVQFKRTFVSTTKVRPEALIQLATQAALPMAQFVGWGVVASNSLLNSLAQRNDDVKKYANVIERYASSVLDVTGTAFGTNDIDLRDFAGSVRPECRRIIYR
jgi:hypothetical protein